MKYSPTVNQGYLILTDIDVRWKSLIAQGKIISISLVAVQGRNRG